jgi:hypothetical protein
MLSALRSATWQGEGESLPARGRAQDGAFALIIARASGDVEATDRGVWTTSTPGFKPSLVELMIQTREHNLAVANHKLPRHCRRRHRRKRSII